jgi:hypothetical protein
MFRMSKRTPPLSIFFTPHVVSVERRTPAPDIRKEQDMSTTAISPAPAAESTAAGQPLTEQELKQARLLLEQTRNSVLGATHGLSTAQWNFKPAPDRWSIAQNLHHLVTVQERILGPIMGQLAEAPPPSAGRDCALIDAVVIHQFPTRLAKFQAPEAAQPAGQCDPQVALQTLRANYGRMLDRLESTPGLREHVLPSPPLKAVSNGTNEFMDGYQWILACAAHDERHAKQMLEVKADASFPER